MFNRWRCKVCI